MELKKADGNKFTEPLQRFAVEDQVLIKATLKDASESADLPSKEPQIVTPPPPKFDYREWLVIVAGQQFETIDGGLFAIFLGDGDEYERNVVYVKIINRKGIVLPRAVPLKFLSKPDLDYLREKLGDETYLKLLSTEDPSLPPGVIIKKPSPSRLPRPLPMSSRYVAPNVQT